MLRQKLTIWGNIGLVLASSLSVISVVVMTSRRPVASLGLAALLGVQLAKGKRQKVNLTLTEAIEIYARGLTTTEKRQSAAAQSQRLTLGHES